MRNKKIIFVFLLIAMVVFLSGCAQDPIVSEDSLNTIIGTVTYNGESIEGVKVTLLKGNEELAIKTTDERGFYKFGELADGTYRLEFLKEGIINESKDISVSGGGNNPLDLDLTDEALLNSITGVVKIDEQIIDEVQVSLYKSEEEIFSDFTDSEGYYEIPDLEDGTYNIKFYKEGEIDESREVTVENGMDLTLNINLSDNEETQLNSIKGKVSYNDKAIEGVLVHLVELDKKIKTDSEGYYEILDLEDGTYNIEFYKEGEIDESRDVTVGNGSDVTLNINVEKELLNGEDVKELVIDINTFGVNMYETADQQLARIAGNMEEMSPYVEILGKELVEIIYYPQKFLEQHHDWYEKYGQYQWTEDGFEYQESESPGDYIWNLSINDNEFIEFKISNEEEVIYYDEDQEQTIIDIEKAYFDYRYFVGGNSKEEAEFYFVGRFAFGDIDSFVEYYDEELNRLYKVPNDFKFNLSGEMKSEKVYTSENSNEEYSLGKASIDFIIDSKLSNSDEEQYFKINGFFASDLISFNGGMSFEFDYVPTLEELIQEKVPRISKVAFDGGLKTDVLELNGNLEIILISSDDSVTIDALILSGMYKELNPENNSNPLTTDGKLEINILSGDEMELTYIGSLDGNFDAEAIDIDLSSYLSSAGQDSEITINYGENSNKYLTGETSFTQEDGIFLNLENEKGLRIEVAFKEINEESQSKIGDVYGDDGEKLAEIFFLDYQLSINIFDLGETITILPPME